MAQKLQPSLAVEGELPEDGLAAYGDDGADLMLALARKIVAGEGTRALSSRSSPRSGRSRPAQRIGPDTAAGAGGGSVFPLAEFMAGTRGSPCGAHPWRRGLHS